MRTKKANIFSFLCKRTHTLHSSKIQSFLYIDWDSQRTQQSVWLLVIIVSYPLHSESVCILLQIHPKDVVHLPWDLLMIGEGWLFHKLCRWTWERVEPSCQCYLTVIYCIFVQNRPKRTRYQKIQVLLLAGNIANNPLIFLFSGTDRRTLPLRCFSRTCRPHS